MRFLPPKSSGHRIRPITSSFLALAVGMAALIFVPAAAPAKIHKLTGEEWRFYKAIKKDKLQARNVMKLDPILCMVARKRAKEMARLGEFSHIDRRGNGPNRRALKAGYQFPAYYERGKTSNNIESIVRTTGTYRYAIKTWKTSTGHKIHVFGLADFYRKQRFCGIGIYRARKGLRERYCVFLAAHPNQAKKPPKVILYDHKKRLLASTRPLKGLVPLR